MDTRNLTLLTDFYEITMMQGYFLSGYADKQVVFDLFYRENPVNSGYAITAGLSQVIEYIKNLKFSEEDITYLASLNVFRPEFLKYLGNFKFRGEIYAIPEGTVVFPQEPLVRVRAALPEAQLIETALLNIINHQSLIATKAARVVHAAEGNTVLEFGLRRAQSPDAGVYGARAAVIGGCAATSNVLCGKLFNIPVRGTHAHSWVMTFPDELSAFRAYMDIYPNSALLLVDTYNTLKSGVPNAIKVFNEMKEKGLPLKNYGIRLDSGDLAYLSKMAREMLDLAGFTDATITASSDLDEILIQSLKGQGAKITSWGVGTNLITSKDWPAFGGVYKLACEFDDTGLEIPKIKLSNNPVKITNPGYKKIFRLYDSETNKIKADLIALEGETINPEEDLTIFNPVMTWKKMTLKAGKYRVRELLAPVFINGECVYDDPPALEIQAVCKREMETLWDEYKRFVNPHLMPVDLSQKLYDLKQKMLREHGKIGVHET